MIEELRKFPSDWTCWAYEGEVQGLCLASPDGKKDACIPNNPEYETEIRNLD